MGAFDQMRQAEKNIVKQRVVLLLICLKHFLAIHKLQGMLCLLIAHRKLVHSSRI